MISRWTKKSAFCLFSTVIYPCEDPSPRLNGVEIFMLCFVLDFFDCTFFSANFFEKFHKYNKKWKKRFRDYHNIYFRISQRIALDYIADKKIGPVIIFIWIFSSSDSLALRCNFAWKRNALSATTKQLQLKNNLLLFPCTIYTAEFCVSFFSAVMREKMNEWKFSTQKYIREFYWMRKNQFPLTQRSGAILMVGDFFREARCRFNSMETTEKNFENISTNFRLFSRKSNFSPREIFFCSVLRPPKQNIWQIVTGYSDN